MAISFILSLKPTKDFASGIFINNPHSQSILSGNVGMKITF